MKKCLSQKNEDTEPDETVLAPEDNPFENLPNDSEPQRQTEWVDYS